MSERNGGAKNRAPGAQDIMDASFDTVVLPKGTLLFSEGDRGTAAYLIARGTIDIVLVRGAQERVIARRGVGELVGEMSIIDRRTRSASARAAEDCELVPITSEQITRRIAETDPILRLCLDVVIARYRETMALLDIDAQTFACRPAESAGSPGLDAALGTLSLENELRRALRDHEFELYFQPIVMLPKRRVAGFEALIRWHHPTRGLIQPSQFIPVAEASGLITQITEWCLAEVGRVYPILFGTGPHHSLPAEPPFIAVNISAHDLTRPTFLASLTRMLNTSGLSPAGFKLEITESVLMKDPALAAKVLDGCRQLGFSMAIDDFGTGYSSLSHLSTLPITAIKIDQSFVRSMVREPTSRKIVHTILRLAEELGIPVVAEGIEALEEEDMLAGLDCSFGQGYLFGRPMSLVDATAFARSGVPSRGPRALPARTPLPNHHPAPVRRATS